MHGYSWEMIANMQRLHPIIFIFYAAFMEIIAETHHRELKLKDLLYGPGIYTKDFHINYFNIFYL